MKLNNNLAIKELESLLKKANEILKDKPKNNKSDDEIKYEYLSKKHLRPNNKLK